MPSGLESLYESATQPLTDAPSRVGKRASELVLDPTADPNEQWFLQPRAFLAGATEGAGDLASSMTSPVNLAAMVLSGGSAGAAKAGLPTIARGLSTTARATSLPAMFHGGSKLVDPASSLAERGSGLAELAGGTLGATQGKLPSLRGRRLITDETGSIDPKPFVKNPADRAAKAAIDQEVLKKLPKVSERRHEDLLQGYSKGRITGKMPEIGMSDEMYQRMMGKFGGRRSTDVQPPKASPLIKSDKLSSDYTKRLRERPGRKEAEKNIIAELIAEMRAEGGR
jgi:hypothetical protein